MLIVFCKQDKLGRVTWFINNGKTTKRLSATKAHAIVDRGRAIHIPYYAFKSHKSNKGQVPDGRILRRMAIQKARKGKD